jgi:hypothetical protein
MSRRFRFSLRALLIVMSCVAVALYLLSLIPVEVVVVTVAVIAIAAFPVLFEWAGIAALRWLRRVWQGRIGRSTEIARRGRPASPGR